jgi:hypothetical protein
MGGGGCRAPTGTEAGNSDNLPAAMFIGIHILLALLKKMKNKESFSFFWWSEHQSAVCLSFLFYVRALHSKYS